MRKQNIAIFFPDYTKIIKNECYILKKSNVDDVA